MWWHWQVPGNVTVRVPAGRCGAVVGPGEKMQPAHTVGCFLITAYRTHTRAYANTQWRRAWEHDSVLYMHMQNENIMLFFLQCDKSTHTYSIKHTDAQPGESFGSPWQLCSELPIRLRELQTPSAITLSCWLHLHNIIEKATGALSLKVKM